MDNLQVIQVPTHQVLGLILGGGKGSRLYPLTKERSKPAVPFAGNYRIIDVAISNCINSGINRVYVLTQYNSASLNKHIAQTYKFDTFHNGFVDILASEQTGENEGADFSLGTADAVRHVLKHLNAFRDVKYVLVMAGDQLFRMDFRNLVSQHVDTGADITVGVLPVPDDELSRFGIVKMSEGHTITQFIEKPMSKGQVAGWEITGNPGDMDNSGKFKDNDLPGKPDGVDLPEKNYFGSMGMYLFNREIIIQLLRDHPEMMDFGNEVIPDAIHNYRVAGFIHDGYWEDIGTIKSYHQANMELTREDSNFCWYDSRFPFFSRARFLPPSKVMNATILSSILSDGTQIFAASVKNSVIGIRSIIEKGTVIENTVIIGADYYETDLEKEANRKRNIPNVGIGENTVVRNAIVDKNVRIGRNVRILNEGQIQNREGADYTIVDGIVCVHKNGIIPDNAII